MVYNEKYPNIRFGDKESLKWQLLKRLSERKRQPHSANTLINIEIEEMIIKATPEYLPYSGGTVHVNYSVKVLETYSNGYQIEDIFYRSKDIEIASRTDTGMERYTNIPLSGSFEDEDFGTINWDGVTQLGLEYPEVFINMNDEYGDNNNPPIDLIASYTSTVSASTLVWGFSPTAIESGEFVYHVENNQLILDKHFVGNVLISLDAKDTQGIDCTTKVHIIHIVCDFEISDELIKGEDGFFVPYDTTEATIPWSGLTCYRHSEEEFYPISSITSAYTYSFPVNNTDKIKERDGFIYWRGNMVDCCVYQEADPNCVLDYCIYVFQEGYPEYPALGTSKEDKTVAYNTSSALAVVNYIGQEISVYKSGTSAITFTSPIHKYFIPNYQLNYSNSGTVEYPCEVIWDVSNEIGKSDVPSSANPIDYATVIQDYDPDAHILYYVYDISDIIPPTDLSYSAHTDNITFNGNVYGHYASGKERILTSYTLTQTVEFTENTLETEKLYDVDVIWNDNNTPKFTEILSIYVDEESGHSHPNPTGICSFYQKANIDKIVTGTSFTLVQYNGGNPGAGTKFVTYNTHDAYIAYSCTLKFETLGKPTEYTFNVGIDDETKGHYWLFTENDNITFTDKYFPSKEGRETHNLTSDERNNLLNAALLAIDDEWFKKALQDDKFSPTNPKNSVSLECQVCQGIADIQFFYDSVTATPDVCVGETVTDGMISSRARLHKVVLGSNVKSIASKVFTNCSALEEFNVSDSNTKLTEITSGEFSGCSALRSVELSHVSSINNSAFKGCSSLASVHVNDKSIKTIANSAFSGCTSLTAIDIANTNSIGASAFTYCTSLTGVTLSSDASLNEIKNETFYNCTSLTGITIPSNIITIGQRAFFNNTKLKVANFNDGLTTIGVSAFSNSFNDSTVRTSTTGITLPNSVTSVGEYAFYNCTYLPSVILSTGMTKIERYTFAECDGNNSASNYGLTTINIIPNIESIEEYAFYNCKKLNEIEFNANVATMLTRIGSHAFYNCYYTTSTDAKGIIIPDTVTDFGNSCSTHKDGLGYVFYNCRYLPSAQMSTAVTYITDYSFCSCENMQTCNLQADKNALLEIIGEGAFQYCESLDGIIFPVALKEIRQWAFEYCSVLSSINITANVNKIGSGSTCEGYAEVFSYCYSLGEITVEDANTTYTNEENGENKNCCMEIATHNVVFGGYKSEIPTGSTAVLIGQYAFEGCIKSSQNYFIPSNIKTVGVKACYACDGITSITFNEGVLETIDKYAFSYCTALTGISTPSSLKNIKDNAFAHDTSLKTASLNENLDFIGVQAFYEDIALDLIKIPETVTMIGNQAFYGCTSMQSIYIGLNTNSIGNKAFAYTPKVTSITVNESSSYYKGTTNCCMNKTDTELVFGCQVSVITASCTTIDEDAFYKCTTLTAITIPTQVKSIGTTSFYWCTNLTGITIPDSVESIGISGFSMCTKMTTATLGNGLTVIATSLFDTCTGLTTVTLGTSVQTINGDAFYRCAIKEITIPKSVTSVAITAFGGCSSLVKLIYAEGCETIIRTNTSNITTVVLPSTAKHINEKCFSGYTSLNYITIPESVSEIGDYAFTYSSINSITCNATTPPTITKTTFYECKDTGTLKVPSSSIEDYTSAWKKTDSYYLGYSTRNWTVEAI